MVKLLISKGADPKLEREIIKYVLTKEGKEEILKTGKYESFLDIKHSDKVTKLIESLNI